MRDVYNGEEIKVKINNIMSDGFVTKKGLSKEELRVYHFSA